jgi:2,5-diketo-D-gluconate reductase B
LIGVSNFTIPLIERAAAFLGPGEIVTNQVELHPYLQCRRLAAACTRNGVSITAYMPLAKGRVLDDPVLKRIGARHFASAASATLAWLLQKGMIVIPASHSRRHMETNLAATSVMLSDAEMSEIDALDRGDRMIDPAKAPEWDVPP